MRARDPGSDFEARLRASIRRRLPSRTASKSEVARDLGTSNRSLDRELCRRGTSYREQLDSVRRELAENRLARDARALSEVSRGLGYTDPANFTRAFRRWTGQSPRSFREARGVK